MQKSKHIVSPRMTDGEASQPDMLHAEIVVVSSLVACTYMSIETWGWQSVWHHHQQTAFRG